MLKDFFKVLRGHIKAPKWHERAPSHIKVTCPLGITIILLLFAPHQRFIYDFRLLKGDVKVEGEGKEEGGVGAVESGQVRRPVPGQLPHTPSQVIVYSSRRPQPPPNLSDFLRLDPGKEIPENPQ